MTEIETTINDAIEGGWKNSFLVTRPQDAYKAKLKIIMLRFEECEGGGWTSKHKENIPLSEALLDPKFWQAVGKTRGWANPESRSHHITATDMETSMQTYNGVWMQNWTDFIQWLADGKAIEEALTEIT